MKILIISTVWPEPTSTAAGSRMLQLLSAFLDQKWSMTYVSTAAPSKHSIDFRALGIKAGSIQVNDSGFDSLVKELNPDIVLFDRFMCEEQFGWRVSQHCPSAVKVLDTGDLHCLRRGRQIARESDRGYEESDLFNEVAIRELACIHRCDLSLMISEYEYALLQRVFKIDASKLHYIPFMVEAIEPEVNWKNREHFVTIGNFRHAPNLDSIRYLKKDIWPLIRKELPGAEMHVYGSYSKESEHQLNDKAIGFLIKGRAEEAIETVSQYRLLLAPLRFGAGLKGKLFDAMQSGTPSVTTVIGLEGISTKDEFPGIVATGFEEFAKKAIELYQNEEEWESSAKRIVPLLKNRFSKDPFELKFIHDLNLLSSNLGDHRKSDFLGQMLNHHTLRSTEYMSRWIEEKNR